jgi:hypothetical protein
MSNAASPRTPSGPLGVQAGLRPELLALGGGEALLHVLGRGLSRLAVAVAEESRAAAPRLIDDVDGIAVGNEVVGPTAAPVRRGEEIRCGLSAAVDHHHCVGTRPVPGNLILHVHLADHDRLLVDLDIASGDREHALVRDLERPARVEQPILRTRRRAHASHGHCKQGGAAEQRDRAVRPDPGVIGACASGRRWHGLILGPRTASGSP